MAKKLKVLSYAEKLEKIRHPIVKEIFIALEGKKARNTSGV